VGLNDALNRRKTGQQHAVPIPVKNDGFMILAEEQKPEPVIPVEPAGQSALDLTLRELRPGEVGTRTEMAYPDVPYDMEALRVLLTRIGKGAAYLLDNLDNDSGHAQIGYFIDLMDSTGAMLTAHMAAGILNKD
jgi:hypothetical protein